MGGCAKHNSIQLQILLRVHWSRVKLAGIFLISAVKVNQLTSFICPGANLSTCWGDLFQASLMKVVLLKARLVLSPPDVWYNLSERNKPNQMHNERFHTALRGLGSLS